MEITPGSLDMMREISDATGIAVEKLQEMGEAQAQLEEVKKGLGGMFSDEDSELISSFAKFKDGKWKVEAGTFSKDLKDLSTRDMERIRTEEKTLEERAEFGRTFDETIQDLILMVKEMLLPLAKSLRENFGDRVKELAKWFNSSEFRTMVEDVITGIGDFIKYVGDFMKNNPITSAIIAGGTLFGGILFEGAKWIASGLALATGFKMGTGGMCGGGVGRGGRGFGVSGGQIGPALPGAKMSGMQKMLGGNVAGGRFAAGSMGSMGLGLGLGAVGMGMQYGRSQMDNPESTGGKMLGIGGTAAQYAGMGAMLGPYGALVGGAIGAGVGTYDEYVTKAEQYRPANFATNDLYNVNDGIMFHPQDKFLKVNDAISIAGTQAGGNAKLAETMSGNKSSNGEMTHKFEDLKITIDVNIPGNEKLGTQLANTPEFIRRINEAINKEIAMAAGGGKLSGAGPKK
jgi:hypothetical protein